MFYLNDKNIHNNNTCEQYTTLAMPPLCIFPMLRNTQVRTHTCFHTYRHTRAEHFDLSKYYAVRYKYYTLYTTSLVSIIMFSLATGMEIKLENKNTNLAAKPWINKDRKAQTFEKLNVNSHIAKKMANYKSIFKCWINKTIYCIVESLIYL